MSGPDDTLLQQRLRSMQIIAAALLSGVVVFVTIALGIVHVQTNGRGLAPAGDWPIQSIGAVVFLTLEAPLAFIVRRFQTRSAVRQIASGAWPLPPGADAEAFASDTAKLLAVRQTTMLIFWAMVEGAAFFGCIAYLLEAQPFTLAVAGVAVLLMLVDFPTERGVSAWLERQLDQLTA